MKPQDVSIGTIAIIKLLIYFGLKSDFSRFRKNLRKPEETKQKGAITRAELIVGHLSGAITPQEPVNFLPR